MAISTVSLSGMVAKLAESGIPGEESRTALKGLASETHGFGRELAVLFGANMLWLAFEALRTKRPSF
jgi:hypothetical protein